MFVCLSHYRDKETLIHLLKGCLGTGILAMPNAFGNAGLALGTVATVLIGILCTYCLHVLVGITMSELSNYVISMTLRPELLRDVMVCLLALG